MSPSSPGDVTGLIAALRAGDTDSLDRLFALLYEELRSRGHWRLESGGGGATLNTTALVHEAYLKLAGASGLDLVDRTHFTWPTAFNPKFKMERDHTLMQGHDYSNHRYIQIAPAATRQG